MPPSELLLQARLVVDNSLLVLLCEYFCEHNSAKLPGSRLVQGVQRWISEHLELLREYTPDGCLYCTDLVAGEFRPRAGRLGSARGITPTDCRALEGHVRSLLTCVTIAAREIEELRRLPDAPKKLIGPNGLSNSDLSLVVLALQLVGDGTSVYVLSNDQDLLSFISWMRSCPQVRAWVRDPGRVQGLQSLTYLEFVHRDCRITTDRIADLIGFAMKEHYRRTDLVATQKGERILEHLLQLQDAVRESMKIKLTKGAAA